MRNQNCGTWQSSHAEASPKNLPPRVVQGTRERANSGVFPSDSRCTPSARTLACPATIVKLRWRPVSSGYRPSLALPLGPLWEVDSWTARWRGGKGVLFLRSSERGWCFHPPASGRTGQGSRSRGEVTWAPAAAPHSLPRARRLPAPARPPGAGTINTRAIIKQTLT